MIDDTYRRYHSGRFGVDAVSEQAMYPDIRISDAPPITVKKKEKSKEKEEEKEREDDDFATGGGSEGYSF